MSRGSPRLKRLGILVLEMIREAGRQEGIKRKPALHIAVEGFQDAGRRMQARRWQSQQSPTCEPTLMRLLVTANIVGTIAVCTPYGSIFKNGQLWWLISSAAFNALMLLCQVLRPAASTMSASQSHNPVAWLKRSASQHLAEASSPGSGRQRRSVSYSRAVKPAPKAACAFVGTWSVVAVESQPGEYDAYLQKLGVSWALRRLAATLKPEPTFSIEDGLLHARTPGAGGVVLHDIFATGRELTISMMGRDVKVVYVWEAGTLLAKVRSPELASGAPIEIRRSIDPNSGRLLATSTCDGVSCTRSYRRKET